MKKATLCFLVKGDEVCLSLKKRGFGLGRWNGFGGKVQDGESIETAATRELNEEANVRANFVEKVAEHTFIFPDNPAWDQVVFAFICRRWEGIPVESEEMRPQWFSVRRIPFESMWPDDKHWVPLILEGKKLLTQFSFGENDKLENFNIREVASFDG